MYIPLDFKFFFWKGNIMSKFKWEREINFCFCFFTFFWNWIIISGSNKNTIIIKTIEMSNEPLSYYTRKSYAVRASERFIRKKIEISPKKTAANAFEEWSPYNDRHEWRMYVMHTHLLFINLIYLILKSHSRWAYVNGHEFTRLQQRQPLNKYIDH